MAGKAAKDAFLDTRVSLLAQQLLRRPEREALLSASEEELRPLLQQAGLRHLVSEPPGDTRTLEQQLATVLVDESLLLMHGMNSDQSRFIRYWLRRLELINLKIILRSKLSGVSAKEILENLLDLGPLTTLPIDALVGTESAEELLRRLESTPYAAMARQARKVYEEHLDLFNAEATLDTHYYHQLVQQARALKSACGGQVRALLGSWLDQINLVSLLRFRLNYRLEAPHAYFLLAPGGHHLPLPVLQQLAQHDSLEQMLALLPPALRQQLGEVTDIESVEYRMISRVRTHARKLLRKRSTPMARAFAYLYLREQQVQLIHTVLKGHLLGLEPELIRFCADPLVNSNHPYRTGVAAS